MRYIIAFLGLLTLMGPCHSADDYISAIQYTETNVYEIRGRLPFLVNLEQPVQVEENNDPFKLTMRTPEKKELFDINCKLYPGSLVHLIREDTKNIHAEILMSSAWEHKNFEGDTLQGACRRPIHKYFYFSKSVFEKSRRENLIHFVKN